MKQLGLAAHMYAENNHNKFPSSKNWSDLLSPTVTNPKAFVCPTDPTHRSSYAFNAKLSERNPNKVNPQTVLFFESDGDWNSSGGPDDLILKRHGSYLVIGFADGSVRQIRSSDVDTLRWDP
jgi:prepilin-type processing-associated H-X9-DG protein